MSWAEGRKSQIRSLHSQIRAAVWKTSTLSGLKRIAYNGLGNCCIHLGGIFRDRNDQGLQNLKDLRHDSEMKGDPLTDILSLTSARCAEVGILVAGGSWALRFPPPQKIKFVAVLKGNCWLTLKDESTPVQVKTGDVFVLPAGRAYVLAGDLNAQQADGFKLFAGATDKIGKVGNGDEFSAVGAHIVSGYTRVAQAGLTPTSRLADRRQLLLRAGQAASAWPWPRTNCRLCEVRVATPPRAVRPANSLLS